MNCPADSLCRYIPGEKRHETMSEIRKSRKREAILARRREWVDLYAYGFSLMEIGRLYDYHHTSVVLQLENAGVKRRCPKWEAEAYFAKHRDTWKEWASLYAAGKSLREIASHAKVHKDTVRKAFYRIGVQIKEPIGRPQGARAAKPRSFAPYRTGRSQTQRIERMMSLACPKKKRFTA
jgi:hypothetical protein